MSQAILIVDDDIILRNTLGLTLERAGYNVQSVASAEAALVMVHTSPPNLILLDIGLPGMDGLQALGELQHFSPVIIVTGRTDEVGEVMGLELGAEDYITKPFGSTILLARIRATLRRRQQAASSQQPGSTALHIGDMEIDPNRYRVTIAGKRVQLSRREFHILHLLALDAGTVISSQDILTHVWGRDSLTDVQNLYAYIRLLRAKVEEDPEHPCRIITVHSTGYKLVPQQIDRL
jgi:DNA-binding response OmpR family regulator